MSTTLHLCILGQRKDISFLGCTWLYIKKGFLCLICNLKEDVCSIIESWSRLILECANMILKIYLHLHMQTQKKSLRLTRHQFWNIFSLCSSNICAESFAQQVANRKPYFMCDILMENIFTKQYILIKAKYLLMHQQRKGN